MEEKEAKKRAEAAVLNEPSTPSWGSPLPGCDHSPQAPAHPLPRGVGLGQQPELDVCLVAPGLANGTQPLSPPGSWCPEEGGPAFPGDLLLSNYSVSSPSLLF